MVVKGSKKVEVEIFFSFCASRHQCIQRSPSFSSSHLHAVQQALDGLGLGVLDFTFLERFSEVCRDEDELGALLGGRRHVFDAAAAAFFSFFFFDTEE